MQKSTGADTALGKPASLLLGTLAIWALVGCSGPAPETSRSQPVTVPASVPTLAPTSAVISAPQTTSREDSTIRPITAADVPPTDSAPRGESPSEPLLQAFPVPAGSRPHDVAPAQDGGVWYTAQGTGDLGWLDPTTGETRHTPLGVGSRPHGVIVGPNGSAWVTDGGLNAVVRVDPEHLVVDVFPLPPERPNANLNTAIFDRNGVLWFTGQNGVYGRLDPSTREMEVFDAPRGRGPYGIAASPNGDVYYASLAGSYVGRIDLDSGKARVLEPPTLNQGARRVWPDSQGRIWVSEWNAGQVAVYDPSGGEWREWKLPGAAPRAYAVYVDERDMVWISDFGANAVVRFDPRREHFEVFDLPSNPSNVRQILGRRGEVWLPESAADQLVVIRY